MSSYKEFLEEKEKIDRLLQKDYEITRVRENLSGAFVEFTNSKNPDEKVELQFLTADARKYFSSIIIANQKKSAVR
ncbi:hypothetical protein [Mesobacillus maritimus]|uniref:hypothetical protein n=1 Tax=Mesobacillus maritimus TaxID=1643336 RepID=UPI00384D4B87